MAQSSKAREKDRPLTEKLRALEDSDRPVAGSHSAHGIPGFSAMPIADTLIFWTPLVRSQRFGHRDCRTFAAAGAGMGVHIIRYAGYKYEEKCQTDSGMLCIWDYDSFKHIHDVCGSSMPGNDSHTLTSAEAVFHITR